VACTRSGRRLTLPPQWFLYKIDNIVQTQAALKALPSGSEIGFELMRTAKRQGFSDLHIATLTGGSEDGVRAARKALGLTPFVKRIDTLAAEYPAHTNYLYTTYNASEHDVAFDEHGTMVLGSGVYRIGSSVEFDWCAVTCARELRKAGKRTVMVNYNPETVSTDYDEADRMYFEELGFERVMDIYELENAHGVVVSVGGACRRGHRSRRDTDDRGRPAPAEHRAPPEGERRERARDGPGADRQRRGPPQVLGHPRRRRDRPAGLGRGDHHRGREGVRRPR
jgi:hypothetical protein